VARLAGVPKPVLLRAAQVLDALEARARAGGPATLAEELPLFARRPPPLPASPLHAMLAELDPDTLSPREAQELLYSLKAAAIGSAAVQQENAVAPALKSVS
jgi:DNA mismatch repair protein MutS